MDQPEQEPICQYDISWRWMRHSGLAGVMDRSVWLIWREIMEIDHQTMRMPSYRRGKDGAIFRCPHRTLVRTTGLSERSVRGACAYLATTELLSYYRPGTGSAHGRAARWSEFGVNGDTLKRLYAYVGPRLPTITGGIWGLKRRELPEAIRIYGMKERISVVLQWEELSAMQTWAEMEDEPPEIEPDELRRICGL